MTVYSPNERPNYPGESPSLLTGRLKYYPDPLNPPDDGDEVCSDCDGKGCDWCGGSGWVSREDLKERFTPDRSGE